MGKIIFALALLPVLAFADSIVVPDGDPLALILGLVQNFKVWGPLVIGSAVIVLIVSALKKFVGDFNYKRVVVASLSVVYAVLQSRIQGLDLLSSLLLALVTHGGALAIYEGIVNPAAQQIAK